MGNICCNKKKEKQNMVILLVGLDNAGKSVAVKGLAGEPLETTIPTVGLSVVYLKYKNYIVKVFDLGGGSNIRGIWQRYFVDVHGVIFVVDSSDYFRMDEAKQVLTELLSHDKISGKPCLLLANKQDCCDALDELDIVEKLDLENLVNRNECPTMVEMCAANETIGKSIDPGIQRGYSWLVKYIARNYQKLNARVNEDVQQQESVEKEERTEKLKRIKSLNEALKKEEDLIESFSDYDRKMNGRAAIIPQTTMDEEIYFIHTTSHNNFDTSTSSSKSIESFPQTYFEEVQPERPKSAVELVKKQLELEHVKRRHSYRSMVSNKTAPVRLYGVKTPKSAYQRRETFLHNKRVLKSAGDASFTVTRLPNSVAFEGHSDSFHNELVYLNNFQNVRQLPSLSPKSVRCNGKRLTNWGHTPSSSSSRSGVGFY